MRSRRFWGWLGLALLGAGQVASAATTTVTEFAPANAPLVFGQWRVTNQAVGGTTSIAAFGSEPSYVENTALGLGVAKLTTIDNIDSAAEVGVYNNFGTAQSVINDPNFTITYSYLKHYNGTAASVATPSLKLEFYNPSVTDGGNDRGWVTLIYEPYQQTTPNNTPPQDTWVTETITKDSKFWSSRGFGQPNGFGGGERKLSEWLTVFNSNFPSSTLQAIRVGMGSNNPYIDGYFDNVSINGTLANATYDFEPTPEPSTLALGGIAAGLLGLQALRRRRAARG